MRLTINGEARDIAPVDGVLDVKQLLETLLVGERRVAVEVNRRIVPRGTYEGHALSEGDVVEIVHFVGGG